MAYSKYMHAYAKIFNNYYYDLKDFFFVSKEGNINTISGMQ